jgi:hypothetical protein
MITPYQPTRNVGLTCRGGFNIAGINHRVKLVRSTAADRELLSALFFRRGGLTRGYSKLDPLLRILSKKHFNCSW